MKLLTTIRLSRETGDHIRELLASHLAVHAVADGPVDDSYWETHAKAIGTLVPMHEDPKTGNKTGKFWTDIKYDKRHPDRFASANVRQPLHTDGSYEADAPNVSFFFCKKQATYGGATTLLDLETLDGCLRAEDKLLRNELYEVPVLFKKGNDQKTSRILGDFKVCWNYFRVASRMPLARRFHTFLESRIVEMGLCTPVDLTPGSALFFRDDKLLHGRNAFIGPRWLRKGGVRWSP